MHPTSHPHWPNPLFGLAVLALAGILACGGGGSSAKPPAPDLLDPASGYLYYTDLGAEHQAPANIGRIKLAKGAQPETLINYLSAPYYLVSDGEYLYWSDYGGGTIFKDRLDGPYRQTFITVDPSGSSPAVGLALSGDYLYWTQPNSNLIGRIKLSTSQVETTWLSTQADPDFPDYPWGLAVNATELFYADQTHNVIRAWSTGTPPALAYTITPNPNYQAVALNGVAATSSYVYWTDGNAYPGEDGGSPQINRAALGSATPTPPVPFIGVGTYVDGNPTFNGNSTGLVVTPDKIYYCDEINGAIWQADLDGNNVIAVLGPDPNRAPYGLAYVPGSPALAPGPPSPPRTTTP